MVDVNHGAPENTGTQPEVETKLQRGFWITVLLLSAALAAKLALKPCAKLSTAPSARELTESTVRPLDRATVPTDVSLEVSDHELLSRYPDRSEMVANLLESFGHNARRIEATDGWDGLRLLDELGDAGVCLYEERPDEFHRLARLVSSDQEAAKLIGAWHRFFDPNQPEHEAAGQLTAEISKLSGRARRLAEKNPESLPFLLADAQRTARSLDRFGPAALEPLAWVDLSDGGSSLRRAIAVLDRYGRLAIDANEAMGPAGFLLVERFGALIDAVHRELGLKRTLLVTAAAFHDIEDLMNRHSTRSVADSLLHLESRGLLDVAAGTPSGLKLAVEFGPEGEEVLQVAGVPGVEVVFTLYAEGRCRNAAVQAIARGGVSAAIAAQKYGTSPDFQRIVARDGAAAILAVGSACSAESARQFLAAKPSRSWTESLALTALRMAGESGDHTIHLIDRDGLERVESISNGSLTMVQFLPLYDLSHLATVVTRGYAPTRGEFVWAGVDAALVAVDVLSLMTLQPEGIAASEAARHGVKSTARATVRTGIESTTTQISETVIGQAVRTTTRQVARQSGEHGIERAAELGAHAAESVGSELAEALAQRSGIRLARWPIEATGRQLRGYVARVPGNRLTKYVAANGAQAAVGLVAVRKMEEYLESRAGSKREK